MDYITDSNPGSSDSHKIEARSEFTTLGGLILSRTDTDTSDLGEHISKTQRPPTLTSQSALRLSITTSLWVSSSQRSRNSCSSSGSPLTLHSQNPLHLLIRTPVFLSGLLDCPTGRIPYAEPGDLGAIFPT